MATEVAEQTTSNLILEGKALVGLPAVFLNAPGERPIACWVVHGLAQHRAGARYYLLFFNKDGRPQRPQQTYMTEDDPERGKSEVAHDHSYFRILPAVALMIEQGERIAGLPALFDHILERLDQTMAKVKKRDQTIREQIERLQKAAVSYQKVGQLERRLKALEEQFAELKRCWVTPGTDNPSTPAIEGPTSSEPKD